MRKDDPFRPIALDECEIVLAEQEEECERCGQARWECECHDEGGES